MTDHKFTDDEIIKAAECCVETEYCATCLATEFCKGMDSLIENALTLINRQKAEIERLNAERNEARNDYVSLIVDIKTNGVRDICDICKHKDAETDCCCDCDDCYSEKCICRDCRYCDKWEWRGRNESQNT